jgi:hypothetical protein
LKSDSRFTIIAGEAAVLDRLKLEGLEGMPVLLQKAFRTELRDVQLGGMPVRRSRSNVNRFSGTHNPGHRMMAIRLTTDGWSANTSRVLAAIMGLSTIQRIER